MARQKKKTAPAKADITYASYLDLEKLLDVQKPVSTAHDEMMFVVVHQTYELWFKLILFELDRVQKIFAQKRIQDADLRVVSASLGRSVVIMRLLVSQLDVMETMTPLDFLDFRHVFRTASGFQSMQFRQLEIRLGLRHEERATYDGRSYDSYLAQADRDALKKAAKKPSLIDQLDTWLARTPFVDMGGYSFWQSYRQAVTDMLEGDRKVIVKNKNLSAEGRAAEVRKLDAMQAQFDGLFDKGPSAAEWRFSNKALQAALFINLYRDEPALQIPFRILHDLMDLDELLALWRYRHSLMAQRMLGTKMGSGGSSGHDYLAATAARHRVFRDLFALSTYLIPRSKLPRLPRAVADKMGFKYWDHDAA